VGFVDLIKYRLLRFSEHKALYLGPQGAFLEYIAFPSEYAYFVGKPRAARWFAWDPEAAPPELWPILGLADLTDSPIDFDATEPTDLDHSAPDAPKLEPGSRALGAAYQLQSQGKPVSLKAACEIAKVDRANLRKNHPKVVRAIQMLSAPDSPIHRGARNCRTGNVDAIEDYEDQDDG
jgi:hypothetical protein